MGQIGHEILDHRHMRQRIDLHIAFAVLYRLRAGECVVAIDIHRAGAADALATGAAEGQGRVDLVLDLDQCVEHHRPAARQIDFILVDMRILSVFLVPAVDAERAHVLRVGLRRIFLAFFVLLEFLGSENSAMSASTFSFYSIRASLLRQIPSISIYPGLRRHRFDFPSRSAYSYARAGSRNCKLLSRRPSPACASASSHRRDSGNPRARARRAIRGAARRS